MKPAYVIVLMLALLSFKLVDYRVLTKSNINYRNSILPGIVKAEDGFSLEFGMLMPAVIYAVQKVLDIPFNLYNSHLIASNIVDFLLFLFIYYLFYLYLKNFFGEAKSIIGTMLLAAVMQITVDGIFPEADFFNLLLFVLGMQLIFKSKAIYLPVVLLLGMFNEMQIAYLIVFYFCFLISSGKMFRRKEIFIKAFSITVCMAVWLIIDSRIGIYGLDVAYNISRNLSNPGLVLQLWIVSVLFIILSVVSFKSSQKFFKLCLIALIPFVILIFLLGNFHDPGKFLPAYLILIPMSLNLLAEKSLPIDK